MTWPGLGEELGERTTGRAVGARQGERATHRQQPREAYFESCSTQGVVFLGSREAVTMTLKTKVK